jgi:Leucine-rich repeat (LRR) protein
MTLNEIKTIDHFQAFLFGQKDENFVKLDSPHFSRTICGTNFSSEILYILPATEKLENIQFYDHLKFITINNYKIGNRQLEILRQHQDKLANVTHLHIWNIKQNELDLLSLFPNLTHLLVSYIRKADFSFNGLKHVKHLKTLCLLSANKISDFHFLAHSLASKLENLSLIYTSSLTSLDGIDKLDSLESLSLHASTPESNKKVDLDHLSGMEKLTQLRTLDIGYFRLDITELKDRLSSLTSLKQFTVDNITYANK